MPPCATIQVNGVSLCPFRIYRGTRQGCPLSPLLFALYIEPLAQRIRDNPEIKGIPFGGERHAVRLYADDILASLTEPHTSIPAFLRELSLFGRMSGLLINTDKSQLLHLGSTTADRARLH